MPVVQPTRCTRTEEVEPQQQWALGEVMMRTLVEVQVLHYYHEHITQTIHLNPQRTAKSQNCKIGNLTLFKFTDELGDRLQTLLDRKKADTLTNQESFELEAIGELDEIFSYINAAIASFS